MTSNPLRSGECVEECKNPKAEKACRENHITVRGSYRWYIGRPSSGWQDVPNPKPLAPGIVSFDVRIGPHKGDEASMGRCYPGCKHNIVVHHGLVGGEKKTSTFALCTGGTVLALQKLTESSFSGPMVMHFFDMELGSALGGASFTKSDLASAKSIMDKCARIASGKASTAAAAVAPAKKSEAPKSSISKHKHKHKHKHRHSSGSHKKRKSRKS